MNGVRDRRDLIAGLVLSIALLAPSSLPAQSQVRLRSAEYFKEAFIPHLWEGTKNTFGRPENWGWLALGGGLTIIAHQYDGQVNDYFKDHKLAWGMADFGNDWWGRGELQGAIAASMMFSGWWLEHEETATAGEVLAEAQIIQGVVINVIKPIANKKRPHKGDNLSFPSGHTGTAFCTAAVLHDRFGWRLGAPAYAFAVITGLARMDVHAHWVSDVVMGATIAMVTGYAVSRHHDDYPYDVKFRKNGVAFLPVIAEDGYGFSLHLRW